jgi:type IV pilus assembly protein PilE
LGLANVMERHFTETNSYLGAGAPDTGTPSIYTIPSETTSFYTVTINAALAGSYTLRADPIGAQATDKCLILTLDNTGAKTNSASLPQPECW